MRRWLVLLLSVFLLAGCTDAPAESNATDAEAPHAHDATKADGKDQGGKDGKSDTDLEGNGTTHSIGMSGVLPTGAYSPGVVTVALEGERRWFPLDMEGTLEDVELTLTWDTQNPTLESLILGFGELKEGDGYQYAEPYETSQGSSPLTLSLSDLEWTSEKYVAWVWFAGSTPVSISTAQTFTIEGAASTS